MVTNARSPGARCYGFVTMSTAEEATKCISHLHRTELHGKMISVEKVGAPLPGLASGWGRGAGWGLGSTLAPLSPPGQK